MQRPIPSSSAPKAALPLWLLILIVGTIVGLSMGRTQSMGLYLPHVTKALDIGREPFGLAMALAQLTMGLGAPFSGGASRPMVPTSEVTPVPLTPMPSSTPLISRSLAEVAAYIR